MLLVEQKSLYFLEVLAKLLHVCRSAADLDESFQVLLFQNDLCVQLCDLQGVLRVLAEQQLMAVFYHGQVAQHFGGNIQELLNRELLLVLDDGVEVGAGQLTVLPAEFFVAQRAQSPVVQHQVSQSGLLYLLVYNFLRNRGFYDQLDKIEAESRVE